MGADDIYHVIMATLKSDYAVLCGPVYQDIVKIIYGAIASLTGQILMSNKSTGLHFHDGCSIIYIFLYRAAFETFNI